MLNRTNRTLSANSNRLNLGTRSLAQTMGADMSQNHLRIRHAHPFTRMVTVRTGFVPGIGYRTPVAIPIPMMPDSSVVSTKLITSSGIRPRVEVRAEAEPVEHSVVVDDRDCLTGRPRGFTLPKVPAKPGPSPRKPYAGSQRSWQAWQGLDSAGAMPRMTLVAAAAVAQGAASGG